MSHRRQPADEIRAVLSSAVNPTRVGSSSRPSHKGWRRERDSNPRNGFPFNGFQDRRLQPLGHLSVLSEVPEPDFTGPWRDPRTLPTLRRFAASLPPGLPKLKAICVFGG